jgi:hypothetical protein
MGQITIRGMNPEMEQEIRKKAFASGKSLNNILLEMISIQTGFKGKKANPQKESLLKLAGGWSNKNAAEFMESIKSCEQIDEEMWK